MLERIATVLIALTLTGCTSAPAVIRALSRDPAGSCASIATVYGTVVVGRGPAGAGGEVVVQGGSCSIRQTRQGGTTP
jgi:starvation-inducible outer membrane lipoprotein